MGEMKVDEPKEMTDKVLLLSSEMCSSKSHFRRMDSIFGLSQFFFSKIKTLFQKTFTLNKFINYNLLLINYL
jgi:hypothetical protein